MLEGSLCAANLCTTVALLVWLVHGAPQEHIAGLAGADSTWALALNSLCNAIEPGLFLF